MSVRISQMNRTPPPVHSVSNPALFPFVQSGVNVACTLQQISPFISIKSLGATGNGSTDDSANVQLIFNLAQTLGLPVFVDPGTYKVQNVTLSQVNAAVTVFGAGRTVSTFSVPINQTGILLNTTGVVTMRDFQITGDVAATAGSLMTLGTNVTLNQFSSFERLRFFQGFQQMNCISAAEQCFTNCDFMNPAANGIGLVLADAVIADAGDMSVTNCCFVSSHGVGTAIFQSSGGGLKMTGCKVISWANGYVLSETAGVSTSDLFLQGNSFEDFSGAAITFAKNLGNIFGTVTITGNEFDGGSQSINMSPDSGPWMGNLIITANNFSITGNSTCVSIVGTQYLKFVSNVLQGNATGTGLNIGTTVSHYDVSHNAFNGFTLNVANTSASATGRIESNDGYNPVGFVATAPTASPWTFVNGPTPSTLSLSAATTISDIQYNGVTSILAHATAANQPINVQLSPNQSVTITYTGAITSKLFVH